jgi:hypothetical protein
MIEYNRYIVCYDNSPLVVISSKFPVLLHTLLEWYSKEYGFPIEKLSITPIEMVVYNGN